MTKRFKGAQAPPQRRGNLALAGSPVFYFGFTLPIGGIVANQEASAFQCICAGNAVALPD
jgi:hypothetical protein